MASDVEGIEVNPGGDFAWEKHRQLVSEETRGRYPTVKCENYDGKYDDDRYFHELNRSVRHATGMWPALSLAIAAVDGKTDDDLIEFARKTTQYNPGAEKLVNYWLDNFEKTCLVTSSYPAVGLLVAEKFGIPFERVFTLGDQRSVVEKDLVTEVKKRSPMSLLSSEREKLGKFLDAYQINCEILGELYSRKEKGADVERTIRDTLGQQKELFGLAGNTGLQRALEYLFWHEKGIMGSHRKVDAMRSVNDDRRLWAYIGDGIVDAMPIEYAAGGISMNMKDKHALSLSKLNVATTNLSKLIPIYEAMLRGDFEPEKLKEDLDSESIRIFTPRDIQKDIEAVVKANGEAKNKLKAMYVPVKTSSDHFFL